MSENVWQVVLADVIGKVCRDSTVVLLPAMVISLVKFVVQLGAAELVEELGNFHSTTVNPNELPFP
jgi:hypothetical protein